MKCFPLYSSRNFLYCPHHLGIMKIQSTLLPFDGGGQKVAAGSGSAPASGSESTPARREGLMPRRESLRLGEGWTIFLNLLSPHPNLPPQGEEELF